MESLQVSDVAEQIESDEVAVEALREDSFSLEVMRFEPGDEDPMHAHGEDEVYYVTAGAGKLNVDGDLTPVSVGDIIHLEPGTEHRFQDFEDELVLTVFYAPAEGSSE